MHWLYRQKRKLRILLFCFLLIMGESRVLVAKNNSTEETKKIFLVAKKKAKSLDEKAYPGYISYNDGNKELQFAGGTFIFYSPKRVASHKVSHCFKIFVSNGKVTHIWDSGYSSISLKGLDITPQKAIEVAMSKDLSKWWEQFPKAKIFAKLGPAKYMGRAPGFGDRSRKGVFFWKLYLGGPGLPEYMNCYIDAKTYEYLGCKKKIVLKEFRNIQ